METEEKTGCKGGCACKQTTRPCNEVSKSEPISVCPEVTLKDLKRNNPYHKSFKRNFSDDELNRRSEMKKGDKNPMWAGDGVTYGQLHGWIKDNYPKPDVCPSCGLSKPLEAHNLTGLYNRDFKNWKWLCRKCHMTSDGRMAAFVTSNRGMSHAQ